MLMAIPSVRRGECAGPMVELSNRRTNPRTESAAAADRTHMPGPHTIILHKGDLRSLVATAMVRAEPTRQNVALLHMVTDDPSEPVRAHYVRQQAQHMGIEQVLDLPLAVLAPGHPSAVGAAAPLTRAHLLLQAAAYAMSMQVQRL